VYQFTDPLATLVIRMVMKDRDLIEYLLSLGLDDDTVVWVMEEE